MMHLCEKTFSNKTAACERLHSHDYALLCLVLGGSLTLRSAEHAYCLQPPGICIIPRAVPHQVLAFSADFSGVYTLSIGSALEQAVESQLATMARTACMSLNALLIVEDQTLYDEALQLLRADTFDVSSLESAEMQCLQQLLVRGSQRARRLENHLSDCSPLDQQRAGKIKTWIDQECSNGEISFDCFELIAGEMACSKAHANRIFKRAFGVTVQGYVLNTKAEQARMLLHGTESLASVAIAAGFYDQSQMTRVFKSVFQLTPQAYRQQQHPG